jgi:hypothetical protein
MDKQSASLVRAYIYNTASRIGSFAFAEPLPVLICSAGSTDLLVEFEVHRSAPDSPRASATI